ncbi:MarR family transcriptional regulator [Streptomyces sp. NPDC059118]|uniref:MarR family transcriptional regulator n=1 Tax=unclassified Streptomyces TaxID=2593676 RepID=UPI0036AF06EC
MADCHAAPARIARRPVSITHRPYRDEALLAEAGIKPDRALLPLLVGIPRFGRTGVADLAERAGRDRSTVSRQVAELSVLGLVERRSSPTGRWIKEAVITDRGRRSTVAPDAARNRLNAPILDHWSERNLLERNLLERDLLERDRLMRRYVGDVIALRGIGRSTS